MKKRLIIATTLLIQASFCATWAADTHLQTSPPSPLATILNDLGSEDFAVRDCAQSELARLSREQLDALREAEKGAKDAEVKARLHTRISEIELGALLHPPKLSVDLTDATLAEAATALNKQMGADYVQFDSDLAARRATLKSREQPLWEILRQLNEQAPMALRDGKAIAPPDRPINTIGLASPTERSPAQPIHVVDDMGILPWVHWHPTNGNLVVGCMIFTDPRVRLTHCVSALRVDKAVGQNGRMLAEIPPDSTAMSSLFGPASTFSCQALFAQDPGLTVIKEFRGKAVVEVVESEEIVGIDLTKEQKEPLVTRLGTFTLKRAANGDLTLKLEPTAAAGTNDTLPEMRVIAAQGDLMQSLKVGTGPQSWGIPRRLATGGGLLTPGIVEIVLSQKTREATLPVVLNNLEVPAIGTPVQMGR